jgi:selenide,water dikinase
MNSLAPPIPVQKSVVLVGAGNAHLVFVRKWRMRPLPGVAVALVNEAPAVPYSAMVPAHIAGEYRREELTIDLVRLCRSAGVRFVPARVVGIDPKTRQVNLADRPPLAYDALSLCLGSVPADLASAATPGFAIPLRPLSVLLDRLDGIEAELKSAFRPFHLAIVGGGASGCELAVAVHNRLGHLPDFRITLLQANSRLLPRFPAKTAAAYEREFRSRGIAWRLSCRVSGREAGTLALADGESLACDAVLWATPGAPPDLVRESGLVTDDRGFLRVRETLQAESDSATFGTGDCVSFAAYPDLARSGVYAVRQGEILFENIASFLHGRSLRRFRPQRRCLYLLNVGDGTAVLNYGPVAWKSRWVRRLKDRIDRRWVESFRPAEMPAVPGEVDDALPQMRCGGCGSKVSGDVLSAVLKRLDPEQDPRVLIGARHGEDAAVFRGEAGGPVQVQTVDHFRSFTDDPYLFGRVAALHAVSDLYAMNARPFAALAIATLPHARGPIQEAQLFELLAGAQRAFRELGVTLAGGHTTEGSELAVGFAMTGLAEENRLFRKGGLTPGDRLILTKPLGTGALLAAWMRGHCRAEWYTAAISTMLWDNRDAAGVFERFGVRACTDVTGFGLAGHLLEMLDASGVGARLYADRVPLLDGVLDVTAAGIVSTLHRDNAKVACRIGGPQPLPAWLFDPQTSGGLLAGVPADQVTEVLRELHSAGYVAASVVGDVMAADDGAPLLLLDHGQQSRSEAITSH